MEISMKDLGIRTKEMAEASFLLASVDNSLVISSMMKPRMEN
jgi:hypothetical protein